MSDTSAATIPTISENIATKDPASISTDEQMHEDVVVNTTIGVAVDTTDKRSQNYNNRQANSFAAKKTVAQGMMDVALITANANQLRYLLEYQRNSPTFYLVMILIIISLSLQVIHNVKDIRYSL